MSAQPPTITQEAAGAHVCSSCALPLVQPQDAERAGRDWLVRLYCPSCGWCGEAQLNQAQMDRLDEELDHGFALLAAALAQATRSNMEEQAERFTAALDADAILPEDF